MGNARTFQKTTGYRGDEILYVGDHIFGDIIRSKDSLNWRTLLIVDELHHEIPILENCRSLQKELDQKILEREVADENYQKSLSKLSFIEKKNKESETP